MREKQKNCPWLFILVTRSSLSDVRIELTSSIRKDRCFNHKAYQTVLGEGLEPPTNC